MIFHSILFEQPDSKKETLEMPVFFVNLNLDQIIDAISVGKQEYNLKPYFYTLLNDVNTIQYRHEIFLDLEKPILFEAIKSFAQKMRTMRDHLTQANKLHYEFQKESWFLDAVEIYCDAVNDLVRDLLPIDLNARGFLVFREYLRAYSESDIFSSLFQDTKRLKANLSAVQYSLIIKGNTVKVCKYETETDYSIDVEQTFEKFKLGAVKDYRVKLSDWLEMNHVEAKVLDFVALLYPDYFASLNNYYVKNKHYLDEKIGVFDREVQFYIAYLEYIEIFKRIGLEFCYPKISNPNKDVYDYEEFDLALAYKLVKEKSPIIICNDFFMEGKERIFVVSGPNQGGKTTFARTFGQLHYLANLGCLVPGREAQLFLFDQLFTHFEKNENIKNLRGKLQDDLVRIADILNRATPNSIIILNEIFTSTTLSDAIFLGTKVLEKIIELDLLCVCVTFIDELSSLGEKTVSMVSTVVPEDPTLRTFKIIRKPADGFSHAISIAEKYRLTYKYLKERLKS